MVLLRRADDGPAPHGMSEGDLPAVSATAVGVAMIRAAESSRPDPLFADPLASDLVAASGWTPPAATPERQARAHALVEWIRVRARRRHHLRVGLTRPEPAGSVAGSGDDTPPPATPAPSQRLGRRGGAARGRGRRRLAGDPSVHVRSGRPARHRRRRAGGVEAQRHRGHRAPHHRARGDGAEHLPQPGVGARRMADAGSHGQGRPARRPRHRDLSHHVPRRASHLDLPRLDRVHPNPGGLAGAVGSRQRAPAPHRDVELPSGQHLADACIDPRGGRHPPHRRRGGRHGRHRAPAHEDPRGDLRRAAAVPRRRPGRGGEGRRRPRRAARLLRRDHDRARRGVPGGQAADLSRARPAVPTIDRTRRSDAAARRARRRHHGSHHERAARPARTAVRRHPAGGPQRARARLRAPSGGHAVAADRARRRIGPRHREPQVLRWDGTRAGPHHARSPRPNSGPRARSVPPHPRRWWRSDRPTVRSEPS